MAYISRDPFARSEVHRDSVAVGTSEGCRWCGSNRKGKLYQYRTESDGGRKSEIPYRFCSISCMRAYHS